MTQFNASLSSSAIIPGFLVNLRTGLNVREYTTRYKYFYLGPVRALDGDMSYTAEGITLQSVASATRVITVVEHVDTETQPGSLSAFKRGKKLFKIELDRGSSTFFPHPLFETLLSISREQDMNGNTRKLISPKGLLAKRVEGSTIVLNRGKYAGDTSYDIQAASSDNYFNVMNNTSYYHVISGEQPSRSYPQRAQDQHLEERSVQKPCRPDKGPNRVFHIRVAPGSPGSLLHPPERFGIYPLATVSQMLQPDEIDGIPGTFYSNVRNELPTVSEFNIIAYTSAQRGDVVTLCNGDPVNATETFVVNAAARSQALDYDMVDNES